MATTSRNLHRIGHMVTAHHLVVNPRLSSLNPSLSISLPNLATKPVLESSSWRTPTIPRRHMATRTSTGAILDEPVRYKRFGLIKVFLTVMAGLTIGASISKKMAAFLEENELFVPDEDDDDDDDD